MMRSMESAVNALQVNVQLPSGQQLSGSLPARDGPEQALTCHYPELGSTVPLRSCSLVSTPSCSVALELSLDLRRKQSSGQGPGQGQGCGVPQEQQAKARHVSLQIRPLTGAGCCSASASSHCSTAAQAYLSLGPRTSTNKRQAPALPALPPLLRQPALRAMLLLLLVATCSLPFLVMVAEPGAAALDASTGLASGPVDVVMPASGTLVETQLPSNFIGLHEALQLQQEQPLWQWQAAVTQTGSGQSGSSDPPAPPQAPGLHGLSSQAVEVLLLSQGLGFLLPHGAHASSAPVASNNTFSHPSRLRGGHGTTSKAPMHSHAREGNSGTSCPSSPHARALIGIISRCCDHKVTFQVTS